MDYLTIHLFKNKNYDLKKIFLLMIPGIVFLVVLTLYISLTQYHRYNAARTSNFTQVLGTQK